MMPDYLAAKRLGDAAYRKALIAGRYPYLPALDDVLDRDTVAGERDLGEMEIPLSEVSGTKTAGRKRSFAWNFMPILEQKTEFASKWSALYDAAAAEGIRDPIKVCEYMHKFYVLEGNKRVSVMKYNGAVSIRAGVSRILPKPTEERENRLYYEFLEFFQYTGIYRISFSELGSYERLLRLFSSGAGREIWPEDLKRRVLSSYDRFSGIYKGRGSGKALAEEGDAFLTYLEVYGLPSLLYQTKGEILQNMEKLQKEFQKPAGEPTLVKAPEDLRKETGAGAGLLEKFLPGAADAAKSLVGKASRPLTVAFLYRKSPESSVWAYAHSLGRNYLEEKLGLGVHCLSYENLDSEEKVAEALEDACGKGQADLVFTTSGRMVQASLKAAVRFPKTRIMNCSVHTPYNSIRTYFGRMYEAEFLMGALAASVTDGDNLGYVEYCPLFGAVANINAFALGAQLVNPWAKVYLRWRGAQGSAWRQDFLRLGIGTISGPELPEPGKQSREYGIFMLSDGELVENVAAPVVDWGKYYERIVDGYLEGDASVHDPKQAGQGKRGKLYPALNYWFGMSAGVVDVILSEDLHYASRKLVELLRKELVSERFSPFEGELRSQDGKRVTAGGRLQDLDIVDMRWLNENVIGEIPPFSAFSEDAQALMLAGGFVS